MLTVFEDPRTILAAICAGADGYLLKKCSVRELIEQTRVVVAGGSTLTAGVARTVLTLVRELGDAPPTGSFEGDRLQLTDREREVLRCLVNGCSYKQAAAELGIQLDTVRAHIRKLYRKLQVHSVSEAVALAIRDGLV
jgi:DNA-binding NarL/FixJ family response regulator